MVPAMTDEAGPRLRVARLPPFHHPELVAQVRLALSLAWAPARAPWVLEPPALSLAVLHSPAALWALQCQAAALRAAVTLIRHFVRLTPEAGLEGWVPPFVLHQIVAAKLLQLVALPALPGGEVRPAGQVQDAARER